MVRLTKPLFSITASGDLGKAIQYICGHYVKKKSLNPTLASILQKGQRNIFTRGANVWSNELDRETKRNWEKFLKIIHEDSTCTDDEFISSGYNLWMFYFLKREEYGWKNYPEPPF